MTNNGFSRSVVPNGGCAYHRNATEYRQQTEVEGTHASVVVACRIVRRLNAKDDMGYLREAREDTV